jgi:hypothetical protein
VVLLYAGIRPERITHAVTLEQYGLPVSFQRLQGKLLTRPSGARREMADILALVLLYDEQRVEQAVTAALAAGQPSKQQVLNCLNRLQDHPQHAPLPSPPALRLLTEPQADPARYDHLRERRHEH